MSVVVYSIERLHFRPREINDAVTLFLFLDELHICDSECDCCVLLKFTCKSFDIPAHI